MSFIDKIVEKAIEKIIKGVDVISNSSNTINQVCSSGDNIQINTSSTTIIDGKNVSGNNISIMNGSIIIDGVDRTDEFSKSHVSNKCIKIVVRGDAESVQSTNGDIKIEGNAKTVETTNGDVTVKGSVQNVKTMNGDINHG